MIDAAAGNAGSVRSATTKSAICEDLKANRERGRQRTAQHRSASGVMHADHKFSKASLLGSLQTCLLRNESVTRMAEYEKPPTAQGRSYHELKPLSPVLKSNQAASYQAERSGVVWLEHGAGVG